MLLAFPAKAIAFDLDDTLCDYESAKNSALDYIASLLTKSSARKEGFLASYRLQEPKLYRAVLSNSITIEEYRQQRFEVPVQLNGISLPSENSVSALNKVYMKRCNEEVQLHPEALSVLQSLHRANIPLAVVTNGPADGQKTKITALGIAVYFDAILISSEEGVAKPDARFYRRAADALQVNMSDLLMVGDSLNDDYYGALRAGGKAVLIDREGRAAGNPEIKRITSLKELL